MSASTGFNIGTGVQSGSIYAARLRNPLLMAAFYQVYIYDQSGRHEVSDYIIREVVVDAQEDFIGQATFTLVGYPFVNTLKRFQQVTIYGGSQDSNNQVWLFKGVIKKIDVAFPVTGVPETTVTAWGSGLQHATSSYTLNYPAPDNPRPWAQVASLKTSDIVKGILTDAKVPFTLNIKNDVVYTVRHPFSQRGTNWLALRELARISQCILAESTVNDETSANQVLFLDRSGQMNSISSTQQNFPIAFRYLERDVNSDFNFVTDQLAPGEISIDSLDFQMDVDFNTGSLRIVSDFTQAETTDGKPSVFVQHYQEETDTLTTYELKSDDVIRQEHSSQEIDALWWRLFKDFDAVTFEDIQSYFRKVDPSGTTPGYEHTQVGMEGAGPIGWMGYTCTVRIIGEVQILPYYRYPVYGIGKYSTQPDGSNKYYLRGLSHHLGPEGYLQELILFR